jgi:hypothetical protein
VAVAETAPTAEAHDTAAVQNRGRRCSRCCCASRGRCRDGLPLLRNPACSIWCRLAWQRAMSLARPQSVLPAASPRPTRRARSARRAMRDSISRRSPVSVIGGAVSSRSPSGAALHVQGQLRVGAQIRVPAALARATAEVRPWRAGAGSRCGGWRPICVRAWRCRQRDAPRWPRRELSPWRCLFLGRDEYEARS